MGGKSSKLAGSDDSKHNRKSLSAPKPPKKDNKDNQIENIESKAVTLYQGPPLGDLWPSSVTRLPFVLENIIEDYLKRDFDFRGYTLAHCKNAIFWDRNLSPEFLAQKIATYAVNGDRKKALMLAKKHPESLKILTRAKGPNNIEAVGLTPFQISISCGNPILSQELIKSGVLTQEEIEAQLNELFPTGWEKRLNERAEQESLRHFRNYIGELIKATESKYEGLTRDYRTVVLKQPTETVTEGLMTNPAMIQAAAQILVKECASMGGWESHKTDLAIQAFQFLMGIRANAFMAQIIVSGMDKYYDYGMAPPERLNFSDGMPFFSRDPSVGVGRSVVFSYNGDKREPTSGWVTCDVLWPLHEFCEFYVKQEENHITALVQRQNGSLKSRMGC